MPSTTVYGGVLHLVLRLNSQSKISRGRLGGVSKKDCPSYSTVDYCPYVELALSRGINRYTSHGRDVSKPL